MQKGVELFCIEIVLRHSLAQITTDPYNFGLLLQEYLAQFSPSLPQDHFFQSAIGTLRKTKAEMFRIFRLTEEWYNEADWIEIERFTANSLESRSTAHHFS